MKNFWNAVDGLNISRVTKYEFTIWILILTGGILGAAAGGMLMCFFSFGWQWCAGLALAGAEQMIPALFFYGCRHDFHEGSFRQEEMKTGKAVCPAEA